VRSFFNAVWNVIFEVFFWLGMLTVLMIPAVGIFALLFFLFARAKAEPGWWFALRVN